MKAVFLCGGVGSRMFPVTEDKFLIKFLGKPLLLHQIYMAREAGLTSFILIGNPQNIDKIKLLLNDVQGIECSYYVQEKPLGMADALKSATAVLNGEILIINPNDVFSIKAYLSILGAYRNNSSESYLLGYKVKQYFPGGYMVVNEIGELTSIIEKPEKGKEPSDLVNIVVHLHKEAKQLLNYIDKVNISQDAVYETAIDLMIKDGLKFKVVGYEDTWMAIKYPWHIFPIYEYFVNQQKAWISPESIISDRAVIEGKVYISDGVRVMENAVIRGPCYIGEKAIIGNNVLIRGGCHIGDNSVIGHASEVKHSYIDDDCWLHSNYIGDSIIGKGCNFGAGTVTANLRFDNRNIMARVKSDIINTNLDKLGVIMGAGCKTGVNASIMPGVRIGNHSTIGANVSLTRDLEPNKMIIEVPQYKVLRNLF